MLNVTPINFLMEQKPTSINGDCMKEKILKSLKVAAVVIKNTVVVLFFLWLASNVLELKKEIAVIKDQQYDNYNTQAKVFSSIIKAISVTGEYIKAVNQESLERDIKINQDSLDRDSKIVETLQVIATETKATSDKQKNDDAKSHTAEQDNKQVPFSADERPSYDYLKDRIVYMVEKIGDTEHGGIGTGVVVKVDESATYILTNKHVCDWAPGNSCFVLGDDKEKFPITLIKKNEVDHDVQLVKTDRPIPGKVAVKGIKDVKPQDKVYFVGNNNGNFFMYSEGTVAGFMRKSGDLLVGAPSGPGNSGSGIFTQDGYLAGILFAGQIFELEEFGGYTMDTSHAICVNSEVLRLFLDGYVS